MSKVYNEIRTRKGEVDDVAIYALHFEQMDNKHWYLAYYKTKKDKRCKTGRRLVRNMFYITSKSKIKVDVMENEIKSVYVEQEE